MTFPPKPAPYLITIKILQWFIEDDPQEEKIIALGDYFKSVNFEIQPLLNKMFTETFENDFNGTKIKDPLRYIIQLKHELKLHLSLDFKTPNKVYKLSSIN